MMTQLQYNWAKL